MTPRRIEVAGQRYGRLVVQRDAEPIERSYAYQRKHRARRVVCICDCGEATTVQLSHRRRGRVTSCGCVRREVAGAKSRTHGRSETIEYNCWQGMLNRCRNPHSQDYQYYGGRGIRVCSRWHSFENFLADMGTKPTAKHSIDRIDNNGNYEPGNCRWATPTEQSRNRRPYGSALQEEARL